VIAQQQQSKTVEWKVDVLWKLVMAVAMAFAGRLSWAAWDASQATLSKVVEAVQAIDKRLTVVEYVQAADRGLGRPSK
jgi:hypothetical protein